MFAQPGCPVCRSVSETAVLTGLRPSPTSHARTSESSFHPPSPEHTPCQPVRAGRPRSAGEGEVRVMEVMHPRCAGIDVSKRDAKVCIRIQGSSGRRTSSTVTTWGAMTNQILALRDHLAAQQVTVVIMEATGDYWRPFYYVLETDFEVLLVNARSVKNVPGRKSDVSDAAWLADLGAHGLVRASFVPPEPIRQLRDLTRTRTHVTRERTREVQRLEKLLESAGIKLL